jgi:hypothetical protein
VLFLIAVPLLLVTVVFVSVQVLTVEALVPSIVNVSSREVGAITWLDIVVSHQPPPAISASHYVSVVQVEVNGTAVDLTQEPQSTETFTVQYSLGSNSNSYSVRVRALCTIHGYSAWFGPVVISANGSQGEKVATPTFSPPGGTYSTAQSVVISCATPGATIRYTLSGEEPTSSSQVYSTPILIPIGSVNTVIKAKAFKDGMMDSDTASATYTIKQEANPQEPLLVYAAVATVAILVVVVVGVLYWRKRTRA